MITLANEIGYLVGVRVDYYAEIDMDGFSQMIDLVGGVDVYNPTLLNDPFTCTYVPAGQRPPGRADGAQVRPIARELPTTTDAGKPPADRDDRPREEDGNPGDAAQAGQPARPGGQVDRHQLPAEDGQELRRDRGAHRARSRTASWGRPTTTTQTRRSRAAHGPVGFSWTRSPTSRSSSSGPTVATTAEPGVVPAPCQNRG